MKKLRITIDNKSYEVTVEDLSDEQNYGVTTPLTPPAARSSVADSEPHPATTSRPRLPIAAGAVTSPMAGQIQNVLVKAGDTVTPGQPLVVLEAMKMENQITAPAAGTISVVEVEVGDSVQEGHVLLVLE